MIVTDVFELQKQYSYAIADIRKIDSTLADVLGDVLHLRIQVLSDILQSLYAEAEHCRSDSTKAVIEAQMNVLINAWMAQLEDEWSDINKKWTYIGTLERMYRS